MITAPAELAGVQHGLHLGCTERDVVSGDNTLATTDTNWKLKPSKSPGVYRFGSDHTAGRAAEPRGEHMFDHIAPASLWGSVCF